MVYKGIKLAAHVTCLIYFMGNILIFGEGSKRGSYKIKQILRDLLYHLRHEGKLGEIYHIYIGNP